MISNHFIQRKYLICFFALFILHACKHDEKNDPKPDYYMPQELKDYVIFPVGSFWVYYDSVSGSLDSIVLTRQEIEIAYTETYGYYYETVEQSFYSSFYNQSTGNGCSPVLNYLTTYQYSRVNHSFLSGSDSVFYESSNSWVIPISITSLILGNRTFLNVKKIDIWTDSIRKSETYWVKGVGSVKSLNDFGNFNLIRYHINN